MKSERDTVPAYINSSFQDHLANWSELKNVTATELFSLVMYTVVAIGKTAGISQGGFMKAAEQMWEHISGPPN